MTQPSETVKEKLTNYIDGIWYGAELPKDPSNNPSKRREFECKLELIQNELLFYFKYLKVWKNILDFEVINCYRKDTALFNEGYLFKMSWTEPGNPYVGHYLALMNSGDILDIDLLRSGETKEKEQDQSVKGKLF